MKDSNNLGQLSPGASVNIAVMEPATKTRRHYWNPHLEHYIASITIRRRGIMDRNILLRKAQSKNISKKGNKTSVTKRRSEEQNFE